MLHDAIFIIPRHLLNILRLAYLILHVDEQDTFSSSNGIFYLRVVPPLLLCFCLCRTAIKLGSGCWAARGFITVNDDLVVSSNIIDFN